MNSSSFAEIKKKEEIIILAREFEDSSKKNQQMEHDLELFWIGLVDSDGLEELGLEAGLGVGLELDVEVEGKGESEAGLEA